jgi:hypothetical protein
VANVVSREEACMPACRRWQAEAVTDEVRALPFGREFVYNVQQELGVRPVG